MKTISASSSFHFRTAQFANGLPCWEAGDSRIDETDQKEEIRYLWC